MNSRDSGRVSRSFPFSEKELYNVQCIVNKGGISMIFPLDGAVRHALTIDPTVWIFDDRKRNVEDLDRAVESDNEAYYAKMGKALSLIHISEPTRRS